MGPTTRARDNRLRVTGGVSSGRQHRHSPCRAPFSVVQRYYDTTMAKEKVTLTLDADQLENLRRITGARSLSAAVDAAVAAYLARLRHLASVDEWLAELEREHGPIPNETLDWAANLVDEWDRSRSASGLRAG